MAQFLRPTSDVAADTWLPNTGASLYGVIDESTANDSDFIFPSSIGECEVALGAGTDPSSNTGHTVRYRAAGNGVNGLRVQLWDNSGTPFKVAEWTEEEASSTLTDYAHTLTTGEADSITDYTDLSLKFALVAPASGLVFDGYADASGTQSGSTIPFNIAVAAGATGATVAVSLETWVGAPTAVTFGGVSMGTPVRTQGWTSGDGLTVYLYSLASASLPTGTVEVVITCADNDSGPYTAAAATVIGGNTTTAFSATDSSYLDASSITTSFTGVSAGNIAFAFTLAASPTAAWTVTGTGVVELGTLTNSYCGAYAPITGTTYSMTFDAGIGGTYHVTIGGAFQ